MVPGGKRLRVVSASTSPPAVFKPLLPAAFPPPNTVAPQATMNMIIAICHLDASLRRSNAKLMNRTGQLLGNYVLQHVPHGNQIRIAANALAFVCHSQSADVLIATLINERRHLRYPRRDLSHVKGDHEIAKCPGGPSVTPRKRMNPIETPQGKGCAVKRRHAISRCVEKIDEITY